MNEPYLINRWRMAEEAAVLAERALFDSALGAPDGSRAPTEAEWLMAKALRNQANALFQLAVPRKDQHNPLVRPKDRERLPYRSTALPQG
jgi:hypothetical protein